MEVLDEEPTPPSFREPEDAGEDPLGEAPATPGTEAAGLVESLRIDPAAGPDEVGEQEQREVRRAPNRDELLDALNLDPDSEVTPVPELDADRMTVLDEARIREGLTCVRVLFDEVTSRTHYEAIEPPLDPDQREAFDFLRETLVQTLQGRGDHDADRWRPVLHDAVRDALDDHGLELPDVARARLHYYLERDFLGYGPIDVLMQDPMIEDISCDGPGIPLYVFHREHESTRTNVVFDEEPALDAFVRRLAQRAGRHISVADPMLDATLPDTSRLQATLAREVTTRGSSFTIRRFRADPLTMPDLIRFGTVNARMAAWYWIAMEAGAPMLVGGGTASGKTTTLSSMCQFIPPAKKVVSIEDTREISLERENWIAALTRSGGGVAGEGDVGMYELLRAALRQRPEYLLVGEVRGEEAQTLFQAMATGHATYSTLHAESTKSAVYRLENRPIDVPRMMLQTLDAISVQTQARVDGRNVRRVKELTEITGIDETSGDLLTNQVYRWTPYDDSFEYLGRSHVLDEWARSENLSREQIEREWADRTLVLGWMAQRGVRHITDVGDVVTTYYADPDRVLDHVRRDLDEADLEEIDPAEEAPT